MLLNTIAMDNLRNRNISITFQNQTYSVPFICVIENRQAPFKVRFELEPPENPTDLEYVTVYYDGEHIQMTTNRGHNISEGYLYDQFSSWYRELYSITVDSL